MQHRVDMLVGPYSRCVPPIPALGALLAMLHSANAAPAGPSATIVAAICTAEIVGLAGYSIVPALLPQFIEAWERPMTAIG
jgi:hypothetical protein